VTFLAGDIYLGINIISGEEVASLLRPLHSFLYLFSSTPNHGPSLLQSFSPVWPPPDRDSIYSRLPRAISAKGTTNSAARLVPVKNPVNASRKEKLAKQSPITLWALGLVFIRCHWWRYAYLFTFGLHCSLSSVIHSFLRGY
jgi:hypothetical protein